jgi:hypothetical protein
MSHPTPSPVPSACIQSVCIGAALLLLSSCSQLPVLRSQADAHITAPTDSSDPAAAQCQALRDQIRSNQESLREAPTISTSPQIVAAAQGRADQRIEELRARLDSLDCASDSDANTARKPRLAPLPPAPNAPNP